MPRRLLEAASEVGDGVFGLGNGLDISIRPNEANQQLHAYTVLDQPTKLTSFEPHLHAPGNRMCLEAIWGYNIQTLSCVGYDHNWVRGYSYADDVAPLLPKGTILHITGYMNNSPSNKNVPDPRNWQGSGNRSVANMFIDLGNRVFMTEEQFQEEMRARVAAAFPGVPDACTYPAVVQLTERLAVAWRVDAAAGHRWDDGRLAAGSWGWDGEDMRGGAMFGRTHEVDDDGELVSHRHVLEVHLALGRRRCRRRAHRAMPIWRKSSAAPDAWSATRSERKSPSTWFPRTTP